MSEEVKQNINQNKIQEFMNKAIGDIASSSSTMLIILGERLGFYKSMAQAKGPISAEELANKTGGGKVGKRMVSQSSSKWIYRV